MACPICINDKARSQHHGTRDALVVECPNCGSFAISGSAAASLRAVPDRDRWKISAWIGEFKPEIFGSYDIDSALKAATPTLSHRADRMLRWLHAKYPPGKLFVVADLGYWEPYENDPSTGVAVIGGSLVSSPLVAVGWSRDTSEMEYMITEVLCNEMGLLVSQNNNEYQVSPKGLLYLEGRTGQQASLGFCAMWFADEVKPLWSDAIHNAIRESGYEPLRIDAKQHNGKIDDEIVASIRSSRFVVADFTGQRGGVYYEAGFAHGLGLPVIFMCREADVTDLHFDIRQYNCILWKQDELEDAKARLKNRILATLGQGPLKIE